MTSKLAAIVAIVTGASSAMGRRRLLIDGIAFRSRMGDEFRMWALFEREDVTVSEHINPEPETHQVTEDTSELLEAFELLGLHWHEDA